MEAIFSRTTGTPIEVAAAEWLRSTRRLLRAVGRGLARALVHYSRAAMLLRGGPRSHRRL